MKRNGGEQALEVDSINLANVLMLLSRSGEDHSTASPTSSSTSCSGGGGGGGRVFECKTCSRRFPSFQALGGHRASHKKLKVVSDDDDNNQGAGLQKQSAASTEQQKPKVHECSICGLEFAMGQALGGHMRRHRAAAEGLEGGDRGFLGKKSTSSSSTTTNGKRVMLDLNLPPLEEDGGEGMKLGVGLGLGLGLVCR